MKLRFPTVLAFVLFLAPLASADTLVAVGDSTWHPFETPSTTSGTAFWNNRSLDGTPESDCNIGYWLTGTGFTAYGGPGSAILAGSPHVTPNYLGDATTKFSMTKAPETQSVTVTSHLQLTAYKLTDVFGYFNLSAPDDLKPLFVGNAIPNNSATFTPSGAYGFYVSSPESTYKSTGEGDTKTHFAVFQLAANDHYMVGTEDMWAGSDRDFNDVIYEVQINGTTVPEPATMVLLGTGLVGIGAAMRRRRNGQGR